MKHLIATLFLITATIFLTFSYLQPIPKNSPKIDQDQLDRIITQLDTKDPLEASFKPYSLQLYAYQQAKKAGIDPERFLDLIECESRFDPDAKNPNSSATGILQYLSGTWEETESYHDGFSAYNPYASIREGVKAIKNNKANQWECKY